jgi:hypothetical protein
MTKKQISHWVREKKQRENIALAALEKYTIEEIMDSIEEACDKDERDDLLSWAASYLALKGVVILRPETMVQQQKIDAFIDELYPYYNEKQAHLELF